MSGADDDSPVTSKHDIERTLGVFRDLHLRIFFQFQKMEIVRIISVFQMMKLFHETESWGSHNLIRDSEKRVKRLTARFQIPVPQNPHEAS